MNEKFSPEEIANILNIIKAECKSHSECEECVYYSEKNDYCGITFCEPSQWEVKSPKRYTPFN